MVSDRKISFGWCVLGAAIGVLLALAVSTSQAAKPARFAVGETYIFVVDCLPSVLMPTGVTPDGREVKANPCYIEKLTVHTNDGDGWLDVVDPDEGKNAVPWALNLSRVYATTPAKNENRRLASR